MRRWYSELSESELAYFYQAKPDADYRINYGRPGGPADRVHNAIDLARALRIAYPGTYDNRKRFENLIGL